MNEADARAMARLERWSLIAGALALVCAAVGWSLAPEAFYYGYLSGFFLWLGLPLGAAGLLMVYHLTGGKWGWSTRTVLEPALVTLPLMVLLFMPVCFGLSSLYAWAVEHEWQTSDALRHKRVYLNAPFYFGRTAMFFAVWVVGALVLWRRSAMQRGQQSEPGSLGLQPFCSVGLIVYVLTVSFAGIDWIASLEPEWYSTIFGMYIIVGQALTALSVAVLVVVWQAHRKSGEQEGGQEGEPALATNTLHDLGNLLLTLVVLHTYMAFSQFFVIWNGNLPHEALWYVPRMTGAWGWISLVLIGVHFGLPFAALLFRHVKRTPGALAAVAGVILFARALDAVWMVLPSLHHRAWVGGVLAIVSIIGIGGLCLALFAWQCRRQDVTIPGPVPESAVK